VQETIETDFEAMNASYKYEALQPSPHPRECLSCRFAKVCPEAGMQEINNRIARFCHRIFFNFLPVFV